LTDNDLCLMNRKL